MTATLYCGDVRQVLATLPERSVQCVVTSPPYFGLRDYGVPGQLGLEKLPDEYVAAMVEVFRGVRRVLRDDGVMWLNLGDSYASAWACNRRNVVGNGSMENGKRADRPNRLVGGLKEKDLIGIPWMTAFALRADGWYLRSDIIWAKPNPMPESVTDRPTKSHEYLFLLTKSERYYYDAQAIAEEGTGRSSGSVAPDKTGAGPGFEIRGGFAKVGNVEWNTRNARTVWTIATQPYSGAHFATFPEELARRCILAGSSAKACETCGAPWERVTERGLMPVGDRPQGKRAREIFEAAGLTDAHARAIRSVGCADAGKALTVMTGAGRNSEDTQRLADEAKAALGGYFREFVFGGEQQTTGWQPTCACEANTGSASSVVLDPFGGSGTVAAVASGHGREAIHIDLNPAYIELARQRIGPMLCTDAA